MDDEEPQSAPTAHEAKRVGYTQTCEVCDTRQPERTMVHDGPLWRCRDSEACFRRLEAYDTAPADGDDLPVESSRIHGGRGTSIAFRLGRLREENES